MNERVFWSLGIGASMVLLTVAITLTSLTKNTVSVNQRWRPRADRPQPQPELLSEEGLKRQLRRMNYRLRGATKLSCREALGSLKELSRSRRRAYTGGQHFVKKRAPKPGEWMAEHRELGQSFDEFLAGDYNKPGGRRRLLHLQPVGQFDPKRSPSLALLQEHARVFFQLPVRVGMPMNAKDLGLPGRTNDNTGKWQVLAGNVMQWLKQFLPPKAYASLGVTMLDLYPSPGWNYVFGYASFRERVGVFSFARYDPAFHGEVRPKGWRAKQLWRSAHVLVHEAGHMFGLHHCIHYECVMNGSNSLEESDGQVMHLCPICLRKLQHAVGFDPAERYRALLAFYRKAGMAYEAAFVQARLQWLKASGP